MATDSLLGGLFNTPSPGEIRRARREGLLANALQGAQTPQGRLGATLGTAIGGLLSEKFRGPSEEEQKAAKIQQVQQKVSELGLDPSKPEFFETTASLFQQAGLPEFAMKTMEAGQQWRNRELPVKQFEYGKERDQVEDQFKERELEMGEERLELTERGQNLEQSRFREQMTASQQEKLNKKIEEENKNEALRRSNTAAGNVRGAFPIAPGMSPEEIAGNANKALRALGQLNPDATGVKEAIEFYEKAINETAYPKQPLVEIKNPGSDPTGKGTEDYWKAVAESATERRKTAQSFVQQNQSYQRLALALSRGAETGFGQNTLVNIKSLAESALGLDFGDTLSEQEIARKVGNELALRMRNPESGLGLTGNTSNKDLAFLKASVAGIDRTVEGNRKLIEMHNRLTEMHTDVARFQENLIKANGGKLPVDLESQVMDYVNDYDLFSDGEVKEIQRFMNGKNTEAPPANARKGPTKGTVVSGFKFKGGDPNDRSNWEPVE